MRDFVIHITGSTTTLQVVADPAAPDVLKKLERSLSDSGARAELSGTVPAARSDATRGDTLRLRSFTIDN